MIEISYELGEICIMESLKPDLSLSQPCIFIGDLHGNLEGLKSIVREYSSDHFLIFLGDFFNSKSDNATVVDIAEIVRIISELEYSNGAITLHSNHNQLVIQSLENEKYLSHSFRGWEVTQAYLKGLSHDGRNWLKQWLSSHPLKLQIETVNNLRIAAAHAYPNPLADKYRKGKYLTSEQKKCIGSGIKFWWNDPTYKDLLLAYDQILIGHYAHIAVKNRLVVLDLAGYQVPIWDPQFGEIKIF
jgi:hypothetical protein